MTLRERMSWPHADAHLALEALARESGLATRTAELLPAPQMPAGFTPQWRNAFNQWIEPAASQLGTEADAVAPQYNEVESFIRNGAPALISCGDKGTVFFYVLLGFRNGRARVMGPDHKIEMVPLEELCLEVRWEEDNQVAHEINALLEAAQLPQSQRKRAMRAMLASRLDGLRLRRCWLLKPSPSLSLWSHAVHAKVPHAFGAAIGFHSLQYVAGIASWWVLGSAGLSGTFQPGWFAAWTLLMLSVIPFRMLEMWWQSAFALRAGAQLKQRLLQGTLKLHPDEVRADGAGRHFGKAAESDAVEQLALGGGLMALLSIVDMIVAGAVLWRGAAGGPHLVMMVGWMAFLGVLCVRHYRRQRRWAVSRIDVTHALLERMEGHRTRLAQEAPNRWHAGEDELLSEYHDISERMDRNGAYLLAFPRRGFMLLGLVALAPAFIFGAPTATALAVSVGGLLLATLALDNAAQSVQALISAATSFEQIRGLLNAAGRTEQQGVIATLPRRAVKDSADHGKPLVDMRALGFRYSQHHKPVIANCDLQIRRGDRLLLEGASGSGKSTLAALLAGLRAPTDGLLLLDGMDQPTLGTFRWQQRITFAPQFHDNHVFAGTFLLNILLGREWPASPEDILIARDICDELGLGPLINRMPGGFNQMVGESGWQLSHGERSRLYIARTLMQQADLVLLDESFAALDPETLSRALRCVLRRADSVMVIAHP